MQKKFGVYTTFSVDEKIIFQFVRSIRDIFQFVRSIRDLFQFNDSGIIYTSNYQGNFHLK